MGPHASVEGVSRARHVALGTLKVFAAEALIVPTGLLTAVLLTRSLGPELYGLFTVAAIIVFWVEVSATIVFSRTAVVRCIAEAADWHAAASTLVRYQLFVSLGAAVLLGATAPLLARGLHTPALTAYLLLFALDVPLFALVSMHQSILIGRGDFGQRALPTASRWLSRLVLMFCFVGLGLSVTGAILASIGASAVALIVVRRFVRPAFLGRSVFSLRPFRSYALPLFFSALALHIFNRLDVLAVHVLSGTPEATGFYGAAQNLTVVPGLFAASFAPLLLATLTQLLQHGHYETARAMTRQALRLTWCLLPFAGMAAGMASDVVGAIYGRPFLPAGPLVALLIFAALGLTMISIATASLTALGHPGLVFAATGPLLPLALGAHLLFVPRYGPVGAAAVTTALAWLGAVVLLLAVHWQYGLFPAFASLFRTTLTTVLAYALASAWHTASAWLVVSLVGVMAFILVCLWLLGELTVQDLTFVRSLWRLERSPVLPRTAPGS